ncbi:MAG TPA: EAL domain-containing protein, partial [Rhodocyclaceae bacterium]
MNAMQVARRGAYSATSVSDLRPELIQRYFRSVDDRYEIVKTIRDVVIFARQDLVLDPPFLRLDLVSCRNVLIYLQPGLQARILSLFHYALLPDGRLFLGKSESVAQQDLLFLPDHKEARIFRRRSDGNRAVPAASGTNLPNPIESMAARGNGRIGVNREQAILKAVNQIFAPPSVVVNAQLQIQHVLGDATDYLQIPAGRISLDLGNLLVRELKVEAQSLLRAAGQKNIAIEGRRRLPLRGRSGPIIRLAVHPLSLDSAERLFLVAFCPTEQLVEVSKPIVEGDASNQELEDELIATREHLQTLVEELETSNEEMQALNEEVQAANEELQATNEELEAANEELQSTNEELLTINEELQVKSVELVKTNSDLECIQDNVGMPILVTDQKGNLTRFNAAAEAMFKMHRGLLGASLSCLVRPPGMDPIDGEVATAIAQRQPRERRLSCDGHEFVMRISLNFGVDGQPAGAITSFHDQTELFRATSLLQESETRMRSVMDHTPSLVATKDVAGRYLYVNENFAACFGLAASKMIGKTDAKVLPEPLARRFREEELIVLRRRELVEAQENVETAQGLRWLHFYRFPLIDISGEVYAVCVQATDITEKRRADEQLRLAARVINGAAEAVVVTDAEQSIVTVNGAFTQITGYTPDEVIGKSPSILKSGRHDAGFYRAMWEQLSRNGVWQGEIENRRKDGEIYAEWLTINAIRDESGVLTNYVAIFSDISSLQEARRKLEFQALHDVLTGLPNRALFNDRAGRAVSRAHRSNLRFAVVFIDLDNFKDINDSLGHESGDLLLKGVAERLRKAVREQDTVARLGGDEFVILAEDLHDGEAEVLVERCRDALCQPFRMKANELYVSASIGIAIYPEDGDEVGVLLQSADAAMYRAKQMGRNTYCFSSVETRRAPAERLNLINGLRQALDADTELAVFFQPQFSLPDRKLIGFEALLRWRSPSLGNIPPDRFIPLAEEAGLILPLTEWLFRTTLRLIVEWRHQGLRPPPISLNVSPLHMRTQSLGDSLMRLLDEFGLPADAVTVEVTESAMGHSPEAVAATLLQLKGLGVLSSLDDFGTGYSSLSRLSRLPITTLKIDRSFVDGLDDVSNLHDLEIARTIVLMAHSLEMRALAEGVETERQLQTLIELGCDAIQGFLLGRPQPAEDVAALLRRG